MKYMKICQEKTIKVLDGICPNGLLYEAKSSSFIGVAGLSLLQYEKERVRWYYLGAFDAYFEKLCMYGGVPK